jgi:hypothetical protein
MLGTVQSAGIELTLRNALEPWHVMGEEGAPGGTARYVDSSLERIEVHVTGMNESRYVITCNGQALPMQNTGTVGEYVAGVRYKAWNPPSALHPSIGTHVPAGVRHCRHLDEALRRRLPVPCGPPGRPELRDLPGQLPTRPRAGACRGLSPWATRRASLHVPPATIDVAGSREFPLCANGF